MPAGAVQSSTACRANIPSGPGTARSTTLHSMAMTEGCPSWYWPIRPCCHWYAESKLM